MNHTPRPTTIVDAMRLKLITSFSPNYLEINDDSAKHLGHAGHDQRGESHFSVMVVSDVFTGKNRVERQRMVYKCLAEEMQGRIHALSLQTLTSQEYNHRS
jgi:BolA protein